MTPAARTLVIGDIHGCHLALDSLLKLVQPQPQDHIILLGDVVDRGPGTPQCIDQLMYLAQHGHVTLIKGNHEEMMLDALSGGPYVGPWLRYGGQDVIDSYGGDFSRVPPSHVEFLSNSVDFWSDDFTICVHASLDPQVELDEQEGNQLRWARFTGEEDPHPSGKRVICGHTIQPFGLPAIHNDWICLDTGAYVGQFLSCLDLGNDMLYQASQMGETRGPVPLLDVAVMM